MNLTKIIRTPNAPSVPKRLGLRLVNYADGDRLVREGWTIAPEEDNNHAEGMVYLERLEAVSESARRLKRKRREVRDETRRP